MSSANSLSLRFLAFSFLSPLPPFRLLVGFPCRRAMRPRILLPCHSVWLLSPYHAVSLFSYRSIRSRRFTRPRVATPRQALGFPLTPLQEVQVEAEEEE